MGIDNPEFTLSLFGAIVAASTTYLRLFTSNALQKTRIEILDDIRDEFLTKELSMANMKDLQAAVGRIESMRDRIAEFGIMAEDRGLRLKSLEEITKRIETEVTILKDRISRCEK